MDKARSKKGRGIWSDEENKTLIELVQSKKRLSWNEIAEELSHECGTAKSGKQCRERYRNYANPELEKSDWKPQEKVLFLVLHKVYGNQWSNIAKHLNSRSDVVVKNYFYSITRKAMKHYKTGRVNASLLKKSTKFYQVFTVLEHIRLEYVPALRDIHSIPKYSHKEKIILNLLKERAVTDDSLKAFQSLMVEKFKKNHSSDDLPVKINVSLKDFKIPSNKVDEMIYHLNNARHPLLSQVVILSIDTGKDVHFESNSSTHLNTISTILPPVSSTQDTNPKLPLLPLVQEPPQIPIPQNTEPYFFACSPNMLQNMYVPPNQYGSSPYSVASYGQYSPTVSPFAAAVHAMQSVSFYQAQAISSPGPVKPMAIRPQIISTKGSSGNLSPGILMHNQQTQVCGQDNLQPARKTKFFYESLSHFS